MINKQIMIAKNKNNMILQYDKSLTFLFFDNKVKQDNNQHIGKINPMQNITYMIISASM